MIKVWMLIVLLEGYSTPNMVFKEKHECVTAQLKVDKFVRSSFRDRFVCIETYIQEKD